MAGENDYLSWSAEPTTRGTASIIFACLSTLIFCSAKILKPNILPSGWQGRGIQLTQILVGIFVPEVVYLMALGQFFDAKGLRDTINMKAEACAMQDEECAPPSKRRLTDTFVTCWHLIWSERQPQYLILVIMLLRIHCKDARDSYYCHRRKAAVALRNGH